MRAGALLCPAAPQRPDGPAAFSDPAPAAPEPIQQRQPAPSPVSLPREEPARAAPELAPVLAPARRPFHRRAGRHFLRLFRPLMLPFLHRLDWRIRGAVDRTETGAAVARIEAALATLAGRVEAVSAGTRTAAARLDALEAARLGDRAELLRAVAEARIPDEVLFGLAIRLDAARLQIRDGTAAAGAAAEGMSAGLRAASDHLSNLLVLLHEKTDRTAAEAVGRMPGRLDALLARTELLLRRNLVPAGQGDVAVRTDDGYVIVPVEEESQVVAMVETAGRLEPGTLRVACALAPEGALAVDVGAHVGTFTVPLARRVGPAGLVVAAEPTPRTAGALRRTLALNGLQDRVELHECAVGSGEGRARLHIAAVGSHNSLLPPPDELVGGTAVEVAVRTLDALVPAGRAASVIKVDAEGMELDVLRGAGRVLAESPRVALIAEFGPSHLARAGIPVASWLDAFRAHGFVAWEIEEESGRLRRLRAAAGLEAVFSLNLLWLRDAPESYPGLLLA
jgi:FkbM family methyltransferase